MVYKLKLTCPIEVEATTEITVEADDLDEAIAGVERELDKIKRKEIEALDAYLRDRDNLPHPDRLVKWYVDQDEIEHEINHKLVDVADWEEVED